MKTYHKIQTVFKRDPETNFKTLLIGEYALPEFKYLENNTWMFTEKVDGMNIRIISNPGGGVEFRGKTDRAQMPPGLLDRLIKLFPWYGKLFEQFPDGACLYGEGYGAKIQKGGGNYSLTPRFVLFDVKVGDWWLERSNVDEIAESLDIDIVPIIGSGTLRDMVDICQNGGFASTWGNFQTEGIVARPAVELFNRNNSRIITKLKCKDFK